MADTIHSIEKEIHSNHDIASFTGHAFNSRLASLLPHYPTTDSQNVSAYIHAIRELNKKLTKFNLSSDIVSPIGAGFRPTNLTNFFGTLKPAKSISNQTKTNLAGNTVLQTTWNSTASESQRYRQVRVVTSGVRNNPDKDDLITLFHFDSSHFSLGKYLITFDVAQVSDGSISINTPMSPTRGRIEVITRDNDEVANSNDNLNKTRFAVKTGPNAITTTLFDDGTTNKEPQIQLFFHRDAIFDVTISNINLRHVSY